MNRSAWEYEFDRRVAETVRANEGWGKNDEARRERQPVRYSVERNGAYISSPTLFGLLALMFGDWLTHLPARWRRR